MARQTMAESLDAKIRKAEEKVISLGDRYNKACEELKELRVKKDAINHEALINAFTKSQKTYDEVMAFLSEGIPEDDPESEQPKRQGRQKRKQV